MSEASTVPTVCYRHPDRPTRLSCSTCARPICIDCTNTAAVGQKCPECAGSRTRVVTANEIRNQGTTATAPATRLILVVTVGIAALQILVPSVWGQIANPLIHNVGAVSDGQIWRAVTAALLHGGLLHVGFNMYALYLFGPSIESRFGTGPFVAFYLAAAAAGGLAFQAFGAGSALGASGAIFGLFGAHVTASFLSRHTAAGRAGLDRLLPLLAINLALPLFVGNIAWQAHVGGLLAGALVMAVWLQAIKGRRPGDKPTGVLIAVPSAVLAVSLGLLLLV